MQHTIRVLIADDHPLFREGMRGRLDWVADVEVVGEALLSPNYLFALQTP